jgi:hypothetical protein
VALSADENSRLASLREEHSDQILKRWTEIVSSSLGGRLSEAELGRQIQELHRTLLAAVASNGFELSGEAAVELRAVLDEVSGSRARQGFTATETAISVFALKDALLDVMPVAEADPAVLRDYLTFGALVDQLGLFTFEAYIKAREESSPTRPSNCSNSPRRWSRSGTGSSPCRWSAVEYLHRSLTHSRGAALAVAEPIPTPASCATRGWAARSDGRCSAPEAGPRWTSTRSTARPRRPCGST